MKIGFDIIFLAIIAASSVLAFVLGEEKSQRMAIGVIIGTLLILELITPIMDLASGRSLELSQVYVSSAIMILCIALCMAGKNIRDSKWPKSKVKALVGGFLSGFVAECFIITSLPEEARNALVTEHNLAALAYNLRLVALGLLVLWLFISYLLVGKAKK